MTSSFEACVCPKKKIVYSFSRLSWNQTINQMQILEMHTFGYNIDKHISGTTLQDKNQFLHMQHERQTEREARITQLQPEILKFIWCALFQWLCSFFFLHLLREFLIFICLCSTGYCSVIKSKSCFYLALFTKTVDTTGRIHHWAREFFLIFAFLILVPFSVS